MRTRLGRLPKLCNPTPPTSLAPLVHHDQSPLPDAQTRSLDPPLRLRGVMISADSEGSLRFRDETENWFFPRKRKSEEISRHLLPLPSPFIPHLPARVGGRATMSIDVNALMMALQAQRAGAEAALLELEAAAGRGANDTETQDAASARGVDDAAVCALATTVLDDLAAWSEMWRGVANRGAAPAPTAASDLEGGTDALVKPRKIMGVSPLMGMGLDGMSELKSAISNRKSAPSAMETTEVGDITGAGVVVVPVTAQIANQSAGKPAWMLELAVKKKAKADAEAALGY